MTANRMVAVKATTKGGDSCLARLVEIVVNRQEINQPLGLDLTIRKEVVRKVP